MTKKSEQWLILGIIFSAIIALGSYTRISGP